MKKVMFMHAGSGNHGCEALVRTSARLLGGPENVWLWSFDAAQEKKYGSDKDLEKIVGSEEIKRFSPQYFSALFQRKILGRENANLTVFLKSLFKNNVAVSIGGDNYCYPWSLQKAVEWNKIIRSSCKYSVLWGCSVEPDVLGDEVKEDIRGYDLITAREPLSYELLKAINPNTVEVADPAFLLETSYAPLPEGFKEGATVGINTSPMIMQYASSGEIVMRNFEELIKYILTETELNVCLIPHVVWEQTNDLEPLGALYEKFKDTGRICVAGDADCTVLKGYIARCTYFVGARTHATIAAYSSCVPTLTAGYSIKSRGIAKSLFGREENYVLPVQSFSDEKSLTDGFIWLLENGDSIKKTLNDIMPEYKEKAKIGAKALSELIGG